jgi:hypothetical protein
MGSKIRSCITRSEVLQSNDSWVTVTWTDLMLVTRTGQDAHGGTHTVFTLEGSIFDTSGFSTGQFLFTSHVNGGTMIRSRQRDISALLAATLIRTRPSSYTIRFTST